MTDFRLLNAIQIAERLGVGRTRTYELLRSGEIAVVRFGRSVRVREEVLEQWILEHEHDSGDGAATVMGS